jgi:hypothetical protein
MNVLNRTCASTVSACCSRCSHKATGNEDDWPDHTHSGLGVLLRTAG